MNILSKEIKNTKKADLHNFYYALAHIVLRNLALDTPLEIKLLTKGKLVTWLWAEAFILSGLDIFPSIKGFECLSATTRDFNFMIFKFPSIKEMGATHPIMSACVRRKGKAGIKYFILENTFDSTAEDPKSFLCEWKKNDMDFWHNLKEPVNGNLSENDFMDAILKSMASEIN